MYVYSPYNPSLVPRPQVIITPGHTQPHYEGTTLDLTCTITVNLTGVDTAVMLDRVFTGVSGNVSAAMEGNVIVSQTFNPLTLSNGGRLFTCIATVDSMSNVHNSQFIVSQLSRDTYSLTVSGLFASSVSLFCVYMHTVIYLSPNSHRTSCSNRKHLSILPHNYLWSVFIVNLHSNCGGPTGCHAQCAVVHSWWTGSE